MAQCECEVGVVALPEGACYWHDPHEGLAVAAWLSTTWEAAETSVVRCLQYWQDGSARMQVL